MRRLPLPTPLLLGLTGVLLQFVPWPHSWVDAIYLARWFPLWQSLASNISALTTGSVSLLAAAALGAVGLLLTISALVVTRRWRPLLSFAVWTAGLLAFWFPLGFGLAYRGTSLAAVTAASSAPTPESVAPWLSAELAALAPWRAAPSAGGTAASEAAAGRCVERTALEVRRRYLPASAPALGSLPRLPERVKLLPAGSLLRFGYAGVVSPWLLEPHVDGGLPEYARLGVALHELAHVAGFAQEAEAEAVAHLAGLTCEDERVRYAATLRLSLGVAAALGSDAAAFTASWPQVALDDARASAAATRRFESAALRRATDAAYDAYLRAQGGSEGLHEYGRGVRLGLALLLDAGVVSDPVGGVDGR